VRYNLIKTLLVGALAFALSACQPLERPFQPKSKSAMRNAAPGPRASLYIEPVQNGPEELSEILSEKLQDLGIAAFSGEEPFNRYKMSSRIILKDDVSYILWTLVDPTGRDTKLRTLQKIGEIVPGPDHAGTDYEKVALHTASDIDVMLGGAGINFEAMATPRLFVPIVENAPGDGSETLASAMQTHLVKAGLDVQPDQWQATYILKGSVDLTKPMGGMQIVSIIWKLERRNGEYVGKVEQKNRIRAGTLNGPWGEVAIAAAQGGARGILNLLRQAEPAYFKDKNG
jgi:hypothetical protein